MASPPIINFTIDTLNQLPIPSKGRICYRDQQSPALVLYVTDKGTKTFYIRRRINKRDQRIRIGKFPTLKIADARTKAALLSGDIEKGLDPAAEKEKAAQEAWTFKQEADDFIERYAKRSNKSWKRQQRDIELYLTPLHNRKLSEVTRAHVDHLHAELGRRAPTQANRMVALVKAIYNRAINKKDWQGRNPAKGIDLFKERSRSRFVQRDELRFLYQALDEEKREYVRDFFWMALLTGSRKRTIQRMRWEELNSILTEWSIPDTKNGLPHTVPLVREATSILQRRKATAQGPWVFPQVSNPERYFDSPQKAWEAIRARATLLLWQQDEGVVRLIRQTEDGFSDYVTPGPARLVRCVLKLAEQEGKQLPTHLLDVRIHDLRRTLGSFQAITGATTVVIGKTLGHKSVISTAVYARLDLDPVRQAMEKATDYMLQYRSS